MGEMLWKKGPVSYTGGDQRTHDLRHLPVARWPFSRVAGLMGRRKRLFLVIPRCASVHTWFMRAEIDIVFLSATGVALGIVETAARWRSYRGPAHTRTVVELPSGYVRQLGLERGDLVSTRR